MGASSTKSVQWSRTLDPHMSLTESSEHSAVCLQNELVLHGSDTVRPSVFPGYKTGCLDHSYASQPVGPYTYTTVLLFLSILFPPFCGVDVRYSTVVHVISRKFPSPLCFHFHCPLSYTMLFSSHHMPIPFQPPFLDFLCDFTQFRCPP